MFTERRKKRMLLAGIYGGAGAAGKLLVTALGGYLLYKFFKTPTATSATEQNLKAAVAAGRPNAEIAAIAMSDPNIATYMHSVGNDPSKTTDQKVSAVTSAVSSLISSVKG